MPKPSIEANDARSDVLSETPSALPRAPRYLARNGFLPRSAVHFADGGAFPEIHVAQYPPGLGLNKTGANAKGSLTGAVTTVTVNASGDTNHDSIITERIGRDKIVHTKHADVVPKPNNVSRTLLLFANPTQPSDTAGPAGF